MLILWQKLDLCYNDTWENARDLARFTEREADDKVFMFLVGVDYSSFDDIKGRILGHIPLPSIRAVFSELRQEEARKRIMNESSPTSAPESSALLNRDTSGLVSRGSSEEMKHFFCDYYKKLWHVKEKCWKLYGKPAHLKKKHDGKAMVAASDVPTQPDMTSAQPFSKDQIDSL